MPDKSTKPPRFCLDCSMDISARHHLAKLCHSCARERQRQYAKRPEIRQRRTDMARAYTRRPEVRARIVARRESPEAREQQRLYRATPEYKARTQAHSQTPEYRTRRRQSRLTTQYRAQRRAGEHRREARKRGLLGTVELTLEQVVQHQNSRCALPWCKRRFSESNPPSEDHFYPIALNGLHDDSNRQAVCGPCNSSKGALDPNTYAQKHGRLFLTPPQPPQSG